MRRRIRTENEAGQNQASVTGAQQNGHNTEYVIKTKQLQARAGHKAVELSATQRLPFQIRPS